MEETPITVDSREVAAHYRSLEDEDLQRLALYEVGDMHPRAVDALRSEIRRRGLDPSLLQAVDLNLRGLTPEDLDSALAVVQGFPCPLCGRSSSPLTACTLGYGIGPLPFPLFRTQVRFGCRPCLHRELKAAKGSVRFRWVLSLLNPFEVLAVIEVLESNRVAPRTLAWQGPSRELLQFTQLNVVPILVGWIMIPPAERQ